MRFLIVLVFASVLFVRRVQADDNKENSQVRSDPFRPGELIVEERGGNGRLRVRGDVFHSGEAIVDEEIPFGNNDDDNSNQDGGDTK